MGRKKNFKFVVVVLAAVLLMAKAVLLVVFLVFHNKISHVANFNVYKQTNIDT